MKTTKLAVDKKERNRLARETLSHIFHNYIQSLTDLILLARELLEQEFESFVNKPPKEKYVLYLTFNFGSEKITGVMLIELMGELMFHKPYEPDINHRFEKSSRRKIRDYEEFIKKMLPLTGKEAAPDRPMLVKMWFEGTSWKNLLNYLRKSEYRGSCPICGIGNVKHRIKEKRRICYVCGFEFCLECHNTNSVFHPENISLCMCKNKSRRFINEKGKIE